MSFSDLNIMVTLALCCTPDEKEGILRKDREQADGLPATNPHHIYQLGVSAMPEHDLHWNYEDRVSQLG